MNQDSAYNQLMAKKKEIRLLGTIQQTLYWDQVTTMPTKAATWRGDQSAFLSGLLHETSTSPEMKQLMADAENEKSNLPDLHPEKVNVAKLKRTMLREQRLDAKFVEKLSRCRINGYHAWEKAKKEKKFELFAGPLAELVELKLEAADRLGYETNPWDTLAQDFEWGVSSKELDRIFTPLQQELTKLVKQLDREPYDHCPKLVGGAYPIEKQKELTKQLVREFGFSEENGYIAESSHPFSITLGPDDFRITTRFMPNDLMSGFMATAHEIGHSLYERGLPKSPIGTPLAEAVSSGIHESQSLFWENRIARSQPFAEKWFSAFSKVFPEIFDGKTPAGFFEAINRVKPDFIRVEADEVTYSLHVIIRFEIEKALINDGLSVKELPELWNAKIKDYLGLEVQDIAKGCLQDVHWSEGLFGYFPSYALGHLMSAQFCETMEKDLGPINQMIASNQYPKILEWLNTNIHKKGNILDAPQLMQEITGEQLSEKAFISYLKKKFLD